MAYFNHFVREGSRKALFETVLGRQLPEAYRKFYVEWKEQEPIPVHYEPLTSEWTRNPETEQVRRQYRAPIVGIVTKEMHNMLLGGENLIKGYTPPKKKYRGRMPAFWFPHIFRNAVYSEILDKYYSVLMTNHCLHLIHENYGFDHYILKTRACDLQTLLALRFKRSMLHELRAKCPSLAAQPEKQAEVYETYNHYLEPYTDEEIDWYGLSYSAAILQLDEMLEKKNQPVPLKHKYRQLLFEQLKEAREEMIRNNETGELSFSDRIKSYLPSFISGDNSSEKKAEEDVDIESQKQRASQ